MRLQEEMIARVRQLCHADERVVAALMYGSFTKGEGDAFSDIEFYLFIRDDAIAALDQEAWLAQVAPVALYFVNEFGSGAAIFKNLVRGEFHFERASEMERIRRWKAAAAFPAPGRMLVVDKTGELTAHLEFLAGPGPDRASAEHVSWLWYSFLNWMLFGTNVLARGERVRALDCLSALHRYLLWLARVHEGTTEHWQTPSKGAEHDLSPAALAMYARCTATLQDGGLEQAYLGAWAWGNGLIRDLAGRLDLDLNEALVASLDARFRGLAARDESHHTGESKSGVLFGE